MRLKKIGLVGGISWTSTLKYYELLNLGINERMGGLNSAECIIYSLNFNDVQNKGWINSFDIILDACIKLEQNNIDYIVLCANTAHLYLEKLRSKLRTPIIDIIEATAKFINTSNYTKIGLLGTKYTMGMNFYRNTLKRYGIEVLIPSKREDIDEIQHIIKNELGKGIINKSSKKKLIHISNNLIKKGANGIVLGCTELPLIIPKEGFSFPVFDTTEIHVNSIIDHILNLN
ncbi:amino acid racemase [uncultured Polaribacter sp.]|uniref:aspartate/glutamate racemase family protein n=1 Tax=uncultured Polaribacter sp. TaxID=174711 RepID=UPI00261579AA|nr:amino acid racemase [uncultured Polaribacter sp.]